MSQYFENDPNIVSKEHQIFYQINEKKFSLTTDNGVFSKSQLDEGTLALLKVLLPLKLQGKILDVGCGYGALGLTLASFLPASQFTLIDINDRACNLARINTKKLKLQNVTVLQSDIYQNVEDIFNSIVINPPIRAGKKVIYSMFKGAYDYLIDGGSLFIVIRKSHGAPSACSYIKEVFGNCELLKRDKGYYIYEAKK